MVVKTRDHRPNRKLSITDFLLAFSIFRDIICSFSPQRREELDLYLYAVVELAKILGNSLLRLLFFFLRRLQLFLPSTR